MKLKLPTFMKSFSVSMKVGKEQRDFKDSTWWMCCWNLEGRKEVHFVLSSMFSLKIPVLLSREKRLDGHDKENRKNMSSNLMEW